ncbi:MAG: transglycosylase SLT domain-containing protein [Paracoccaceae bacterium]|nr:transglycosylase SLT domain-containing protein [Paracoccaceae bacterium]
MGATDDPRIAAICDTAAAQVSRESGVPLSVLRAISLTETGRSKGGAFRPWPWTVNMEGKGVWFRTRAEAQDYVDAHFERGARSFDVGCFQINYKWHGAAFATIEEMFDPVANARYAARFLGELRAEFGDWSRAAGAYHSRTPQVANRYRARFDRIRARLTGPGDDRAAETVVATRPAAGTVPQPPPVIRANLFPLLQPQGGRRGAGSLVPLTGEPASGLRMIGGPGRG